MSKTGVTIPDKSALKKEYERYTPLFEKIRESIEIKLKKELKLSSSPSFKSRIKLFNSYYRKLLKSKPPTLGKLKLPVLTDIIGLRIICPFLEDLEAAEKQILNMFTVTEIERKGSGRTFSEFGYESTHMLITIPEQFAVQDLPEQLVCEIQIRTLLQDAWAEVEHELVYKSEFSPFDLPLKRKLASMNASLSLADIVFQEVRNYQNKLNQELALRRESFYDKAEKLSHEKLSADLPPIPSSIQTIASPSPYVQGTIDDLILAAIQAHNAGKLDTAVAIYTQIIGANPKPNDVIMSVIFKHRGLAYFAQSKYDDALQDFLHSARLDPEGPRAYYYTGIVYSVLADHLHAIKYFSRSLELHEFQSHVYYRRAISLYELGDYSASLADLDRCRSLGLEDNDCRTLRVNLLKKLQMD